MTCVFSRMTETSEGCEDLRPSRDPPSLRAILEPHLGERRDHLTPSSRRTSGSSSPRAASDHPATLHQPSPPHTVIPAHAGIQLSARSIRPPRDPPPTATTSHRLPGESRNPAFSPSAKKRSTPIHPPFRLAIPIFPRLISDTQKHTSPPRRATPSKTVRKTTFHPLSQGLRRSSETVRFGRQTAFLPLLRSDDLSN